MTVNVIPIVTILTSNDRLSDRKAHVSDRRPFISEVPLHVLASRLDAVARELDLPTVPRHVANDDWQMSPTCPILGFLSDTHRLPIGDSSV
jgi:hypothetical protein